MTASSIPAIPQPVDEAGNEHGALDAAHNWLTPFHPAPLLGGGHRQTLAGNYWRRPALDLPCEATAVEVDPRDGSRVLCHCHWQPESIRGERLTILVVHGLGGSSNSRYMRGISALAWQEGCNVIRMNMRNCGGTEAWSPTLYHSGLSGDVSAVLHHFAAVHRLTRVAVVGYSMGGNLVLKLAGEIAENAPQWLVAAVGVSPACNLAPSADALHEPANRIYEWHFLRNLMKRFRRKAELFPAIYGTEFPRSIRTIREFDDKITARYSGFLGADDYYFRASAARVVSQIAIPTLVLHAFDDPFIRITRETREALIDNPNIRLIETAHGGHCAFLARVESTRTWPSRIEQTRSPRHWAESTLVNFLLSATPKLNP